MEQTCASVEQEIEREMEYRAEKLMSEYLGPKAVGNYLSLDREDRISCIERIKIPASRELTPSKRTEAVEWFLVNVACREKDEEIREMAFKKLGLCDDLQAGGTD